MHRRSLIMFAALAAVAGCTSVKSTYLHRNEDDTGWKKNHMKGVPITLDVPTHIRFNIIERYFIVDGQPLRYPAPKNEAVVARDVKYDMITEKKIFTVDMKRPAAGPYQNTTKFDDQYITSIDHRLDDQTIEQVGKQVNALVSTLTTGSLPTGFATSSAADLAASNISIVESTACSAVFKLDAPDFEAQVAEFLRSNSIPLTKVPAQPGVVESLAPTIPTNATAGVVIGPPGTNVGISGSIGRSGNTGPLAEPTPDQVDHPAVNTVPGVLKVLDPKPAAGQGSLGPSKPATLDDVASTPPLLARTSSGRPKSDGSVAVAGRPAPNRLLPAPR